MSFDAASDEHIFQALKAALQGLAQIPDDSGKASLYFEDKTPLLSRRISPSFTVGDFLGFLTDTQEDDLAVLLLELEDKADAIADLSDEATEELANICYYYTELAFEKSSDTLGLLATVDGILFTVLTDEFWNRHEIPFGTYPAPDFSQRPSIAYSVCNESTGKAIAAARSVPHEGAPLAEVLAQCELTDAFLDWATNLSPENYSIVLRKLRFAQSREFDGGKPLFDTLNDAGGMREVRMPAFNGGAIRVLFGSLPNGRIALLRGFVKKSNGGGYKDNIPPATADWDKLKIEVTTH